ncbi:MAG: glycosyltransferase family 4 protein [Tildeniella nuda ZEHNDER 1965/U140]|jgi:glycosyltransferase involved in cell wall biosynthesis|nr:glycosyltransferase family 4 protein [Tildeniella nuda ZEHNDER 1965/U140]
MKATIVYDYQAFLLQEYGGISRYFYELASRISQAEHFSTRVIAPAYINQYLNNLNPHYLTGFLVPPIRRTVRIRSTINREVTRFALSLIRPDLVHETYYASERLAAKKTKIITTIHDMIPEKFSELFPPSHPIPLLKKKSIIRADCIICVSENTRKDVLERFNVDPQNVFVTHLGCSLNPLPQKAVKTEQVFRPYILYVGHREGYKNFSGFLKAFTRSKLLKKDFKIICFGATPFSQAEMHQFSSYNLSVAQIQHLSGDDTVLASLYANASALVYPSLYEGFGIPPLEAMSYNCPVVCSDSSSIPEVVGNAAELFNPYEPESITNALERVLYVSDRTQALIRLGTERVKQFTWENCVEKTCAIYASLL